MSDADKAFIAKREKIERLLKDPKTDPLTRKSLLAQDNPQRPQSRPFETDYVAFTESVNTVRGQRTVKMPDGVPDIQFKQGMVGTNSADVAKFLEAQPGVTVQQPRREAQRKIFFISAVPWRKAQEA